MFENSGFYRRKNAGKLKQNKYMTFNFLFHPEKNFQKIRILSSKPCRRRVQTEFGLDCRVAGSLLCVKAQDRNFSPFVTRFYKIKIKENFNILRNYLYNT